MRLETEDKERATYINTMKMANTEGPSRSNIGGAQSFTSNEQVVFAISDDDLETFEGFDLSVDIIRDARFAQGMNILNLIVDQESVEIAKYLAEMLKDEPAVKLSLVDHSYGNNKIRAIH